MDLKKCRLDHAIQREATTNPAARKLQQLRSIGLITATALVAAIGDASVFKKGRDLAAWLALVPRPHSSGGKERLLGICRRGDSYLRMLLIHGAQAVIKTARLVWALLVRDSNYGLGHCSQHGGRIYVSSRT